MPFNYDSRFPSVEDLRVRARQRIPRFAFEYLEGGCNEDVNLARNTSDLRQIDLTPQYLTEHRGSDMRTELKISLFTLRLECFEKNSNAVEPSLFSKSTTREFPNDFSSIRSVDRVRAK